MSGYSRSSGPSPSLVEPGCRDENEDEKDDQVVGEEFDPSSSSSATLVEHSAEPIPVSLTDTTLERPPSRAATTKDLGETSSATPSRPKIRRISTSASARSEPPTASSSSNRFTRLISSLSNIFSGNNKPERPDTNIVTDEAPEEQETPVTETPINTTPHITRSKSLSAANSVVRKAKVKAPPIFTTSLSNTASVSATWPFPRKRSLTSVHGLLNTAFDWIPIPSRAASTVGVSLSRTTSIAAPLLPSTNSTTTSVLSPINSPISPTSPSTTVAASSILAEIMRSNRDRERDSTKDREYKEYRDSREAREERERERERIRDARDREREKERQATLGRSTTIPIPSSSNSNTNATSATPTSSSLSRHQELHSMPSMPNLKRTKSTIRAPALDAYTYGPSRVVMEEEGRKATVTNGKIGSGIQRPSTALPQTTHENANGIQRPSTTVPLPISGAGHGAGYGDGNGSVGSSSAAIGAGRYHNIEPASHAGYDSAFTSQSPPSSFYAPNEGFDRLGPSGSPSASLAASATASTATSNGSGGGSGAGHERRSSGGHGNSQPRSRSRRHTTTSRQHQRPELEQHSSHESRRETQPTLHRSTSQYYNGNETDVAIQSHYQPLSKKQQIHILEERGKALMQGLREAQSSLRDAQITLRDTQIKLKAKENELKSKESELRMMDGALRSRDEEARRREDELSRVQKEIAVLTDGINIRDAEVLRLHEELSEKEEEIRKKEAEGRKREEALRKRESEVERLQGDLAEAEEELKRKGEALRRAARAESDHQEHRRSGEGGTSTSASSVRSGHSVHGRGGDDGVSVHRSPKKANLDRGGSVRSLGSGSSAYGAGGGQGRKRSATVSESSHLTDLRRRASMNIIPLATVQARVSPANNSNMDTKAREAKAPSSNGRSEASSSSEADTDASNEEMETASESSSNSMASSSGASDASVESNSKKAGTRKRATEHATTPEPRALGHPSPPVNGNQTQGSTTGQISAPGLKTPTASLGLDTATPTQSRPPLLPSPAVAPSPGMVRSTSSGTGALASPAISRSISAGSGVGSDGAVANVGRGTPPLRNSGVDTSTSSPTGSRPTSSVFSSPSRPTSTAATSRPVSTVSATTSTETTPVHVPKLSLALPPSPVPAPRLPQTSAIATQPQSSPPPPPPPPPSVASNTTYSTLSEHIALHRSSEAFLTRTDTWSGAQVIQAVQDINSLILQFAASVAEIGRFFVREVDADSAANGSGVQPRGAGVEGTRSYADTLQRLGPALTKLLATYDHSNDPILVQLALQTLVCVASKKAWETFCLGLPGKSDGVLSVIYRSVRELEPQPTSAKWRSLTHSHIHSIYPTLAAYSANELAETVLRWTVDILVLAGCVGIGGPGSPSVSSAMPAQSANGSPPSQASSSIPNPNQLFALTRPRLLPSLIHLTRALTTLENVLRQDVLSTSFDLVIPEFGSMWNARVMSDMFGAGAGGMAGPHIPKASTGGRVLGCVEIGLGCRTRMGFKGPPPSPLTPSSSSAGGKGLLSFGSPIAQQPPSNSQTESGKPEVVYEERLLLQPKVVLESVVDLL